MEKSLKRMWVLRINALNNETKETTTNTFVFEDERTAKTFAITVQLVIHPAPKYDCKVELTETDVVTPEKVSELLSDVAHLVDKLADKF
jgi:hypothetical protein